MKKKFLTILTFLTVIVLAMAFIACTDYTKEETPSEEPAETVSYTQTVKNGTFYDVSKSSESLSYYDKMTSWTITAAGLAVPTSGKDLTTGVFAAAVDLTDAASFAQISKEFEITDEELANEEGVYEKLKDDDGNPAPITVTNPGVDERTPVKVDSDGKTVIGDDGKPVLQDTNALLLASGVTSGSIYAKSSSVTLKKNSVYKFSFSVYSDVEKEASGAFVFIRGDMEKEYRAIKTKDADGKNGWKTYTLYIETYKTADMSITIELWLGYGPKRSDNSSYANDGYDALATRGYALFDNISMTRLVDEISEGNEAVEALFADEYEAFDAEKSIHENFLAFSETVDSYSAYYIKDADLANRTHITSSTYFGDSSYRKYFYEFRDYTSANTSSSYWNKMDDFIAGSAYYGIVDLNRLYKADNETINYSPDMPKSKFMTSEDWQNKVLTDTVKALPEQYALMIYNNELGASGFTTADANSLSVEADKYYKVSVFAYVWKGDGISYDKIAPTSSSSGDTTAKQRAVYSIYAEASSPLNVANVHYFDALTDDEKGELGALTESFDMEKFKSDTETASVYTDMITKTKSWMQTAFGLSSVNDDTAASFLYTYLYYSYLYKDSYDDGETAYEVVATIDYAQASQVTEGSNRKSLDQYGFTLDNLRKGYLEERKSNINIKDLMVEKITAYDTAKEEFERSYNEWKAANDSTPYAILRVSGAGKDIDAKTTGVDGWEELTLYIRGNQLSSRTVSISLILGENDSNATKMVGGVFFDDVLIEECTGEEVLPEGKEWQILAEIKDGSNISFGELTTTGSELKTEDVVTEGKWEYEKAEGTADNDDKFISVTIEKEENDIELKDASHASYKLVYAHTEATASSLTYNGANVFTIAPNKYYRLAFHVNTVEEDGEKPTVSISLLNRKKNETEWSVLDSSVSDYSTDGFAEVVYYIRGDLKDTYELTLKFAMGSGTRFSTSGYLKGTVEIATFNCLEINYTEYNDHKTGDKIVSGKSLYSTSYSIDSGLIKNASYSTINYSKTDKDSFDEDGNLKDDAIIIPDNWTTGTAISNAYETPTLTLDGKILTWTAVKGYNNKGESVTAESYEIWLKYTDGDDEVEKLYIKTSNTTFTLPETCTDWVSCSVAVKAADTNGVSSLSSYKTLTVAIGTAIPPVASGEKKITSGAKKVTNDFDGSSYKTPYDFIYTIRSDYPVAVAVSSSALTLSANKFYKISVFVKTANGAKGGIILEGSDGSVEAELTDGVIGYLNINNTEWQEYNIYLKTGNFTVSPVVKLCLGNPNGKSKKVADAEGKTYYGEGILSMGEIYFDAVRASEIDEEEYELAVERASEGNKELKADDKLLFDDITTKVYTLHYTMDSFDTTGKPEAPTSSSKAEQYGGNPNNYTHGKNGDITSEENVSSNFTYGIYNAQSEDEDMLTALSYLYSNEVDGEKKMMFNKVFGGEYADYSDAQWKTFLKQFLSLDIGGKSGGDNVLAMSNKMPVGLEQYYDIADSYKVNVEAGSYYKFTFAANTFIAKPVFTEVTFSDVPEGEEARKTWWADKLKEKDYYTGETKKVAATATYDATAKYYTVSYTFDDAFAELIFDTKETGVETLKMYLSSYSKVGESETLTGSKTYTLYLYNPSSSAKSNVSWSFYLGNKSDDYLVGLIAIDLVSMEKIDKETYEAGVKTIASNYDADGKVINAKASTLKFEYAEDEPEEETDKDNEEEDNTQEEEKKDFWTNLVNDQYFWLYISSFVLGIIIIIVVIVVIVRKVKEKHPKKVVVENIAKTEKDIHVVEPEAQEKEELEADEYTDEIQKPVVKQRVLPKKKKK